MTYFVMECVGVHPIKPIDRGPIGFRGNWRSGSPITKAVPQPLVYLLSQDFDGDPKPMYYEESVPIMRADVVAVLAAAGVDNIQYFDAVVKDPGTGQEYADYKAYNIVGLVSCADMQASTLMGTSNSTLGDADFDALVIDEPSARGARLFRMAENVSAIVVDEQVKQAIVASAIPGFKFYGPGEWSG